MTESGTQDKIDWSFDAIVFKIIEYLKVHENLTFHKDILLQFTDC